MSRLLQLSEAASLALHGAALIAAHPGELFSVRRIAETAGASEHHLSKVLQRLVKAGILTSVRGPKGGFVLAVPAESVSLLEIYEAIEGRTAVGACPVHRPSCPFQGCMFGGLFGKLNRDVVEYFKMKKLSEFTPRDQGRKRERYH
jgi:Rrf2 family protein